jgi:hypothetical protein
MYPPDWPRCPYCGDYVMDGKPTCGVSTCVAAHLRAVRSDVLARPIGDDSNEEDGRGNDTL